MLIEEHIKGEIYVPVNNGNDTFRIEKCDFTENDIIRDSCSITSRCCDDKTFSIGGVRPAELSIKLRIDNPDVNAYTLYGAKIRLYSAYHAAPVPDDKWLLRGEFWVTSVKRNRTVYTLSASDALVWLDSGSYAAVGQTETSSENDPLYKVCISTIVSLSNRFNNNICPYLNERLNDASVDEITFDIRDDITNNFPTLYASETLWGYVLLPPDISGNKGVKSIKDYFAWAAELAAGCIQMVVLPDSPDICKLMITPYGYHKDDDTDGGAWKGPVKIQYSEIELDSCDIADYELYIQKEYMETYNGIRWANGGVFAKYKGNITIDLTNNMFLAGRYYHDRDHAYPWVPMINIGEQLNTVKKRPFNLKCHHVFETAASLPKLGQPIEIEVQPEAWEESFITKMVWRFRGGWEFGSAGSDSRVLSQAAKRSLASNAEERAKAYANVIAKSAGDSIATVKNTADTALGTANTANATAINVLNAWNNNIPSILSRLSALENRPK